MGTLNSCWDKLSHPLRHIAIGAGFEACSFFDDLTNRYPIQQEFADTVTRVRVKVLTNTNILEKGDSILEYPLRFRFYQALWSVGLSSLSFSDTVTRT